MEIEGGIHKSAPRGDWSSLYSEKTPEPERGPGRHPRLFLALALVLIICVIAGGWLLIQRVNTPHTAPLITLAKKSGWCAVAGPGGFNSNYAAPQLNGIAALSANNVWIVGSYADTVLVEHWDGQHWSIVPSPDLSKSGNSGLNSISALSSNDIWAVGAIVPGYEHFNSAMGIHTLVEHWDGQHWSVVPSPDIQAAGNELRGVVALAPDDVWVVGRTRPDFASSTPLIEHWNGSSWSLAQLPAAFSAGFFQSVTATSANDVWAVGGLGTTGQLTSGIAHWNGQQWQMVKGASNATLLHIAAHDARDIWTTGFDGFIEHWDGKSWNRIRDPHLINQSGRGVNDVLSGITVVEANDVWVVGAQFGAANSPQIVMEHWDGKSWSAVSHQAAQMGTLTNLATANGKFWAIGTTEAGPQQIESTLIETMC